MTCPRCGRRMQAFEEREVEIDFCAGCKGTWLDKNELAAFASDDVKARLLEESLFESTLISPARSSMKCPVCAGEMTEGGLFAADFRIDRCDRCAGIWFDKRELSRLGELQAPRKPPPKTKASREKTVTSPAAKRARHHPADDIDEPVLRAVAAELARRGLPMRASREPLCPSCKRGPSIRDLWQCTCGWVWNVFRTGARCPTCGHDWKETRCPGCKVWSPHFLWYAG